MMAIRERGASHPPIMNSNWRRSDESINGASRKRRSAHSAHMENSMVLRMAFCLGLAGTIFVLATPSRAQKPPQMPPSAAATTPAPGAEQGDAFGEDTMLTGKPMVYLKGNGTWDSAFDTITGSIKKLKAFIDKEGLKSDGQPFTIFTATDDTGFQYQAAIPIAEAPKNPPQGDIAVGTSPEGHALKFVHRGSYDALDNTYEAITNFLDERRLEAKDMFIEQYVTDPLTTNEDHLVVNVFVMVK
jgi:effector-binding domain-containing protein